MNWPQVAAVALPKFVLRWTASKTTEQAATQEHLVNL